MSNANSKSASRIFMSPLVRFMMPVLIEPRKVVIKGVDTGKMQFSLRALVPQESLGKFTMTVDNVDTTVNVKEVAMEIAKEKWPDSKLEDLFPVATGKVGSRGLRKGWPLLNGDKLAENMEADDRGGSFADAHKGHIAINMKSKDDIVPTLRVWENKKARILSRDNPKDVASAKAYFGLSGNYGYVEFTMKATEFGGGCFLTCYVNSVMFAKEGEKFGRGSMMDRFGGVDGGEGDYDPSADESFE